MRLLSHREYRKVPDAPGPDLLMILVCFMRSKLVFSSVAILSSIVLTQHVPNLQCPGSLHVRSTHTRIHKLMSDMSNSTMGIGLNGWSVTGFLFTLLTE